MQGESRGGNGVQGKRGRAGRLRAAAWRLHAWIGSKGEASSAKQEVAGVDARHASPLLVLLAEEEEDKGGGGGLGRPLGPPGGCAGEVSPGKVSLLSAFLFLFLFVSFVCFEIVKLLFHLGKT